MDISTLHSIRKYISPSAISIDAGYHKSFLATKFKRFRAGYKYNEGDGHLTQMEKIRLKPILEQIIKALEDDILTQHNKE